MVSRATVPTACRRFVRWWGLDDGLEIGLNLSPLLLILFNRFGTYYWAQDIDPAIIQTWSDLSSPEMPPADSMLSLPPKNPFVPTKFDIKPTPPDDCNHPLLNCSLKLCIIIGKQKVSRW